MKKLFALILVISNTALFAQTPSGEGAKELEWKNWNEGFAKSQQTNKIALIDVYTDWCGWCKVMDKNTYTNTTVINKINDHFVPIKFNPEKPEKYIIGKDTLDGRTLLGALSGGQSSGYPTTYFLIPGQNQIFQQPGYIEPGQFIELLDNVISRAKK